MSAGWWWCSRRRAPAGRGLLLLVGAATLAAGLLTAALLPALHWRLVHAVLADLLPYHVLLPGAALAVALPTLAPLGALCGFALADGRRTGRLAFLAGAALALALAPALGEVLLGHRNGLAVAALLGAPAAVVLAERAPLPCGSPRLPRGSAAGLLAAGWAAVIGHALLVPLVDVGSNSPAWLAAAIAAGAALACLRSSRAHPVELALAPLVPLTLPLAPAVRSLRATPPVEPGSWPEALAAALPGTTAWMDEHLALLVDLGRLAALGLPLGLLAGRALAGGHRDGPSLATLPALLLGTAPLALLVLLPRAGAQPALLALAALAALHALVAARPRPGPARLGLVAALGAGLVLLEVPDGPGGERPLSVRHLADGSVSFVRDPLEAGRTRVALDGRAPLQRHSLQEHRMVHVPFLLHGAAERVLVVASDQGEAETAAREHEPADLEWLRPFPVPGGPSWDPEPPDRRRPLASERLYLALDEPLYDLIVLLPDPRVRRRAGLLGTRGFFRELLHNLEGNGLACQWWDLATVDVSDLKAVIASAAAVFPQVWLVVDHPRSRRAQLGLVVGRAPLSRSPEDVADDLAALPGVRDELLRVGLEPAFVLCLIGQDRGLLELLAPAEESLSDRRPTLGARGGLRPLPQPRTLFTALETFGRRRISPLRWVVQEPGSNRRLDALVWDVLAGWQHLFGAAALVVDGHGPLVRPFEAEWPGECPEVEGSYLVAALADLPGWAWLADQVLGWAARLEREGRVDEAVAALKHALTGNALSPRLRWALGALYERRGERAGAVELYRSVLAIVPGHASARAALERLDEPLPDLTDG